MYETSGALTIVEPRGLLVLVVIPLLWTLGVLTAGRRMTLSSRIAIAGAAGNLAFVALIARGFVTSPRGYVFGENLGSILRLGRLDLAADLVVDPLAVCFLVLVALLALAAVLHEVWAGRGDRRLAWIGLLATGASLVVTADGFAPLLAGLGLTTAAALVITRGPRAAPTAVAIAGDGALVLALFFTFWALGGSFGAAAGYESDPLPRVLLVGSPEASAETTLAMTAPRGALVTTDEGPPLPGEPLRAPFEVPVTAAGYTFRIQLGPGAGEVVVPRVAIAGGHAYTLAPFGPTASLLSLRDQARLARPVTLGAAPLNVRELLATRAIGGLRASVVVALLVAIGLVARLVALASRTGASLAVAVEALVPAYVALRLADLFDPRAADGAVLAALGAVAAVVLAGYAAMLSASDLRGGVRAVLAATTALTITAAGFGAIAGGLLVAGTAALAGAGALAAIEARRDARWLGVAAAAACGLVPASGISAGVATSLARALDAAATFPGSGAYVAALVAVVVALAAFASFRVYDASISDLETPVGPRGQGVLAMTLASLGLAAGIVFGMGTAAFGGRVVPLVARILGLEVAAVRGDVYSALALSVVAPAIGFFAARHARSDAVANAAAAPARMARALGESLGRASEFLAAGVAVLDRAVIEDVGRAAGQGILALAGALGRVDRFVDERVADAVLGRIADRAALRLGFDHPRVVARVAVAFVGAMVAVLALVVLSSVVLG